MHDNQQSTAKEQRNDGEQDSPANIASPMWVRFKTQIGETSHIGGAQERPKQKHDSNQDGSVEKRVEIVFRQRWEDAVSCKRLS